MDARKALLRSRMKQAAQQRETRIVSPLVRYNEVGQPVCKVCNVAVKSEALWPAHLVSRQHKEAADEVKARAKSAGILAAKPPPVPAPKSELPSPPPAAPAPAQGVRPSSALPADFFDSPDSKKPRLPGQETVKASATADAKGALPEGFFDSVDADHRARGLEPPKVDLNGEYKEFQKFIEEDLKEVDYRHEEEEFAAAEEREEREQMEQRSLLEKVEMFKKKQQEKAAALAATGVNSLQQEEGEEAEEQSSSDEESEEDTYYVDWRAKHL